NFLCSIYFIRHPILQHMRCNVHKIFLHSRKGRASSIESALPLHLFGCSFNVKMLAALIRSQSILPQTPYLKYHSTSFDKLTVKNHIDDTDAHTNLHMMKMLV